MSTYLYLRCQDHTPPIEAADESGQHLYDLPQIRTDIANREALVAAWRDDVQPDDYFRRHTVRFLAQHPACRLAIWDEYGREHATTEVVAPPALTNAEEA